ncbi:MAG TPA: lyase [Gemmatimonadota bacterium]|nr:lyase [Gemmatimonadota bacterium]
MKRLFLTLLVVAVAGSIFVIAGRVLFADPRASESPASESVANLSVVQDAGSVVIEEWPVPWEDSRPRDPYVGPEGRVWFVGQRADYLATLDAASGEFQRFELDPGTGPHNLIVGGDGTVWYAGNRAAHIGRFDPATGEIHKIPMPDPAARDPHTLTFDPAGDIWFSVQGGNFVGHLDVETEAVRLAAVPTADSRPYGIVVDDEGTPWFTEFGSHKIGAVDPSTMEIREIVLPRPEARPRRLAVIDSGVWYVDHAAGYLGRIDPASGAVEEWAVPGGSEARPYAMTADDSGRLWFVESGPSPNRLVGFDPAAKEFFSISEIPSGGGTVRHMVYHAPARAIWFGTDTNTIGRAQLP